MLTLRSTVSYIVLPNPVWNDNVRFNHTVSLKRSMDGTRYTTIKKRNRRMSYTLTVELTRAKFTEFENFYKLYCGETLTLELYDGRLIRGTIKTNPLSGVMVARRVGATGLIIANEEMVNVTFEFEGSIE